MKKLIPIICLAIFLGGCATSQYGDGGPFVTDITFDDKGNMLITKDTVAFVEGGPFTHLRNRGNPITTIVKIPKNEK